MTDTTVVAIGLLYGCITSTVALFTALAARHRAHVTERRLFVRTLRDARRRAADEHRVPVNGQEARRS